MLAGLLELERVRVGVTASDKDSALLAVASLLTMPEDRVNPETVYEVLLERERLASTGVGSSVAIPHGRCDDFDELRAAEPEGRFWLFSTKAERCLWDAEVRDGDFLVFGSVGAGLPGEWTEAAGERAVRMPMVGVGARSVSVGGGAGFAV